jgi:hypothetical protein
MTDKEAKDFLVNNNITFIVYGTDEKKLGGHIYPFLKLIFDSPKTKLYAL